MAINKKKVTKNSVRNFWPRINRIDLKTKKGDFVRSITTPDDFIDFTTDREKRNTVPNYKYEVIPTNPENKSNVEAATKGTKALIEGLSRKKNISVTHGGRARDKFGERLLKGQSPTTKFLQDVDVKKDDIVKRTPDDDLIEIARKKDGVRYLQVLHDNELGEYSTNSEKADAIREFVISRSGMKTAKRTPDGFASGVVWNAAKESKDLDHQVRDYGTDTFDDIDKVLSRNYTTQKGVMKIMKKNVSKKYGPPDSASRKLFNAVKRERGFTTDRETMKHLETEEGKQDAIDILVAKTRKGDMKQSTARSIQNKLKLPGGTIIAEEMKVGTVLRPNKQKQLIGNLLGYTGASGANSLGAKFLHKKLSDDPDALRAMQKGDEETVRDKLPTSVSYDELYSFKGKNPKLQEIKRLKQSGVDVSGLPSAIEEKVAGTYKEKPSGRERGRPSLGDRGRPITRGKAPGYKEGGGLLSEDEFTYVGGKPVIRKKRGKIAETLYATRRRIPGMRTRGEKETFRREKWRQRESTGKRKYEEARKSKEFQYLSDEELKYAMMTGDPAKRRYLLYKGRKMYRDPAYRAKKLAKREERKGIYEARLAKEMTASRRRMKAATSPWWKAWYTLTHNMYVLIGVIAAIAILFLPVGMFYVLGWLIAAGLVSLFMFIIWVFIELWWLIAQALVAFINLVGQAIIGVVNWVGGAIAGALGQTFTPFEHILVQNMFLVERDPVTGERTILGITWGQFNLVPPSFLKLDEFMPRTFDTDTIITKIFPAIRNFFVWYTKPIAERYTDYIATTEWYEIAAILGIPIILVIMGVVVFMLYIRRKLI